jgi:hypothetical protein
MGHKSTTNWRAALAAACGLVMTSVCTTAAAFGTIHGMGQDAEHERITRRAFTCAPSSAPGSCFEPDTLDSLAGERGSFGAVGAPDRGRGMLNSFAHCTGGDFLDVPGYPQSREEARRSLTACRDYMMENLNHAVADAARLLDDEGRIRAREIPGRLSCVYVGSQHGRAKCDVLAHLGLILHATQDFYSHSNWADQPDPDRPIGADNPPGLGNLGRAAWLDLRAEAPAFPEGLISGCFDNMSFVDEARGCVYGDNGEHRIRHLDVNKDMGPIDPEIGVGTTSRGAIGDNFRRAVEAAIEDSVDKWAVFRERLAAAYGAERAELMVCALTRDDPVNDCV